MPQKKLGRNLEWHGNRIRVVIRVPPSQVPKLGKTKLKETLKTTDPLEAEREKVDVIRRLRASLAGTKATAVQSSLVEQALEVKRLREEGRLRMDNAGPEEEGYDPEDDAFSETVDAVERQHGLEAAETFAAVALGNRTPLTALVDRWFAEKAELSIGYKDDIRRSLARLEAWCGRTRTPKSVEAITQRVAGRYIHDQFIEPGVDVKTANKDLSCLRSYWRWLKKRHGTQENPWLEQSLEKPKQRREVISGKKRPFTDDEVRKLLTGMRSEREREFSLTSALSGLRLEEVAGLRVEDCANGCLRVTDAKTPSGLRTIPAHPGLMDLIARRTAGKGPDEYLFHDLEEQREGSKRDRSAPVSQAFTRERRRLGVDERGSEEQRQSNIDFHSWRRWFIRQAVQGLERGAQGYTAWTIANVVGHKAEDGTLDGTALPLGMTMGRYAGAASLEAMRACVEAVKLPTGI
ncbi:tyrosine-type recombinase/integrase [Methylobacterium nigriterrae]|uniref:tyrosine-type recombinase/integrase n=1 Tax=Methylobacterium nigriterrae TaxID=3127512 RepID=UPI0030139001